MKKETNSDAFKIMKFVLKKILKNINNCSKKIYLCKTAFNGHIFG